MARRIAQAPLGPVPDELKTPVAPTETIAMISPTGEAMQVPAEQAATLAGLGYKQITPEFTAAQAEAAKYGEGIVQELEAAGLGILRGSTLGLSDLALRKINPEWADSAAKLKQYNPDASMAGELASFALPMLGGVKALGTVGKAAKATGILQGLVSSGGEGLGKIATKIVGENLAGHTLGGAVNMAAQSAVYQAAHNLSEDALGDKDVTVESILANTGQAAILGAGLGAALPVAARTAEAVVESAPVRYVKSAAVRQFEKFLDPERAVQLYSGAMSKPSLFRATKTGEDFRESVKRFWDRGAYRGGDVTLDKATGELVNAEIGQLPNQAAMFDRLTKIKQQAGEGIGETLKTVDDIAKTAGAFRTAESSISVPTASRITPEERALFYGSGGEKSSVFGWSGAEQEAISGQLAKWRKASQITEKELDRYTNATNEIANDVSRATTLSELHDIRMGLDKRITGENFKKVTNEDIEIVKDLRAIVSKKIEAGFSELEEKGLASKSSTWKKLNETFHDASEILGPLDWQVARAESNVNVGGLRWRDLLATNVGAAGGAAVGGPIGAAVGAGLGIANRMLQTDIGLLMRAQVGEKLRNLAWAESMMNKTNHEISGSVKAFLGNTPAALAQSGVAKYGAPIAYAMSESKHPPARIKGQQEWFDETRKQILSVVSNPEQFAKSQGDESQSFADHAPGVADALVGKQLQVYSYLAQIMPKNPGMPTSIFADKWKPADYQIQQFRKVVQVARAPLTILQDLRNGTITGDQVQAVKALYPRIYENILEKVREEVSNPSLKTTYEQRLKLGLMFQGTEPTTAPEFIAAMQQPLSKPDDQQQKMRPPGGSVSLSKNKMTSTERAANR